MCGRRQPDPAHRNADGLDNPFGLAWLFVDREQYMPAPLRHA